MAGTGATTLAPRGLTARQRLAASLGLVVLLGLALGSGLARTFSLVDDGVAGRLAMAIHLATGLAFALMLLLWLPGHILRRNVRGLGRPVRGVAYAVTVAGVLTVVSGLLVALPLALWTLHVAWYPATLGPLVTDLHMVVGLVLAMLAAGHLLVRPTGAPPRDRC